MVSESASLPGDGHAGPALEPPRGGAGPYAAGRRFEYRVQRALGRAGWTVMRSAQSGSAADLVAFRPSRVALIQCKRNGAAGPREREALVRFANRATTEVYVVRSHRRSLKVRDVTRWADGWEDFLGVF